MSEKYVVEDNESYETKEFNSLGDLINFVEAEYDTFISDEVLTEISLLIEKGIPYEKELYIPLRQEKSNIFSV